MTSLDEIHIALEAIGHALSDKFLSVPTYQRSYAWSQKEVRDLLQDLSTAMSDHRREYFVGSVVVTASGTDRPHVVDGQQRLATVTIFIAAIRDYFVNSNNAAYADDVEREYLLVKQLRTQERVPRLILNDIDGEFFRCRILSRPGTEERKIIPTKDSHRRIGSAADIAREKVRELAAFSNKPVDYLIDWIEYLSEKVKVIWVSVPDSTNAFTIFETLNDRGLALAISDLLKNFLFGEAEDRISEVQQRWISMLGALDTIGGESITVTYIRHLWSSKYGITREKELYSKIKETITNKQFAVNFATELEQGSRLYAAILNSDSEYWNELGTAARRDIATLNDLGMVQMRPLLIAILEQLEPPEISKCLRLLTSWAVRFLISGKLGTGLLESHYCQRATGIRSQAITSVKHLIEAMDGVVPNDTEFKTEFAAANVSKPSLARYYLRCLENAQRGGAEPALVPNDNEQIVNLEHILPQNPSSGWGHISTEIAHAYFNRLGNLALMESSPNSAVGNGSFITKCAVYKEAQFELTSSLCDYDQWGVAEIEARQLKLAELATKAWPYRI